MPHATDPDIAIAPCCKETTQALANGARIQRVPDLLADLHRQRIAWREGNALETDLADGKPLPLPFGGRQCRLIGYGFGLRSCARLRRHMGGPHGGRRAGLLRSGLWGNRGRRLRDNRSGNWRILGRRSTRRRSDRDRRRRLNRLPRGGLNRVRLRLGQSRPSNCQQAEKHGGASPQS